MIKGVIIGKKPPSPALTCKSADIPTIQAIISPKQMVKRFAFLFIKYLDSFIYNVAYYL